MNPSAKLEPQLPAKPETETRPLGLAGWLAASLGMNEAIDLSPQRLRAAQAAHLHEALPVAMLGTSLACVLFAVLYWGRGFDEAVIAWSLLGLSTGVLRWSLHKGYSPQDRQAGHELRTHRFLVLCTVATTLAACMFGWGWWALTPHLSADEQAALMMTNVVMLFGGLYAYSPYLPAFISFAWISLMPGIAVVWSRGQVAGEWLGNTFGLVLMLVVSTMLAVRTARAFRTNMALQSRVLGLLDEVTAKRDEAVSATLAKSRFLASVSHDLRQPMHAINLYLNALATHHAQQHVEPERREHAAVLADGIANLQESTLYLNSMFESLLDVSRLDAGAVGVNIRHTNLVRMLAQLEADYTKLAQVENLRFEVQLPPRFELLEVHTDPALLERLLRNLLVNAFRYTERGGVRLSVKVRGRMLDFRVVDTGPGIARNLRLQVFEEFFQVPGSQIRHSRNANTGRGIGLGLSISGRLAEKLGSRIRLYSHLGQGSVFALSQPVRLALRPQSDTLGGHAAANTGSFGPGTFVAVVDDDLEIRRSTRVMLEALGAEVYTAESGAQAVDQLGRGGRLPDVLLCDYRLEWENGLEAIRMVREEFNADIPAILITGDTSPEHVAEFRASGVRVLYKPISGDQLRLAIWEELQATRSLSEELRPTAP